jgi:hypothetical protein
MEFTYTLTENDYLNAAAIKVARSAGRPWSRLLSVTYIVLFYLSVGLTVVAGRTLEWFDLTGNKLANLPLTGVMTSSIMPMTMLPLFFLILFKTVTYFPNQRVRREQFRSCLGCKVKMTAVVSSQSIAFRSEIGSSECSWKCFAAWNSQNGLLVLTNHAGTRQILKIAALNPAQHSELMQILSTALPRP